MHATGTHTATWQRIPPVLVLTARRLAEQLRSPQHPLCNPCNTPATTPHHADLYQLLSGHLGARSQGLYCANLTCMVCTSSSTCMYQPRRQVLGLYPAAYASLLLANQQDCAAWCNHAEKDWAGWPQPWTTLLGVSSAVWNVHSEGASVTRCH
jgi:hypothetical protein